MLRLRVLAAFVILLSCMVPASVSAQTTSPPVETFHKNGTFAFTSGFSGPTTSIFLQVNRGQSSGGAPSTFLFFDTFAFTSQGFTDTFGSGEIPNTALTGDSTDHLTLAVDTSQVSGFKVTTCTFTFFPFSETCQSGPFGPIQVHWQKTNQFSEKITSTEQLDFTQFTIIQDSNSEIAFDLTQISYLGTSFTNSGGIVGVEHNTNISIVRK